MEWPLEGGHKTYGPSPFARADALTSPRLLEAESADADTHGGMAVVRIFDLDLLDGGITAKGLGG